MSADQIAESLAEVARRAAVTGFNAATKRTGIEVDQEKAAAYLTEEIKSIYLQAYDDMIEAGSCGMIDAAMMTFQASFTLAGSRAYHKTLLEEQNNAC